MVGISFSKEVAEDTRLLTSITIEFLREFSKMALDGLLKGTVNKKVYTAAAGRLSTTAEAIEKGINALAEVLLECAKKNLSIADFELSVADLRFNDEAKTFLGEFYGANVKDIRGHLSSMSLQLPHYHNLDWRLDVQLATRCLRNQATPSLVMELETKDQSSASTTTVLQADFATLRHMCDELEKAVAESRSTHSRRIIRYVK